MEEDPARVLKPEITYLPAGSLVNRQMPEYSGECRVYRGRVVVTTPTRKGHLE